MERAPVLEEQGSVVTPSGETARAEPTERISPQLADCRFLAHTAEQQVRWLLERFAASVSVSLSATLGAGVTVTLETLEQTTRRGYGPSSSQSFLFGLSARPYLGKAILALSPALVTHFLERLLGASGTGPEIARELTAIESSVLDLALQTISGDLRGAWSGFAQIDFRPAGEHDRNLATAEEDGDEPMIAASLRLHVGGTAGLMGVAVPWLAVVAAQQEVSESGASTATAETAPRKSVFEMLQNLNLRLEARLQGATVLASQLLRLKEGDVLGLGCPVERPIDCLVNGNCMYKVRVISSGSRISLRIDQPVVSPGP